MAFRGRLTNIRALGDSALGGFGRAQVRNHYKTISASVFKDTVSRALYYIFDC